MSTDPFNLRHNGQIIKSKEVAGFYLSETTYAPLVKVPSHSHQHACFCLVLQGTYKELYRRKTVECTPSLLVFRPAGETHSDHFDDQQVRCFLIELDAAWLERLGKYSVVMNQPTEFQRSSVVGLAMRLRAESRQADSVTPLAIEGLMLEMVAEASRGTTEVSEPGHPRWLKQAREILHHQFTERTTLSSIAKAVGVHPMHLASVFKQQYRYSVGEYVRRLRIEFACHEITATNTSLADVALAAGFSHQSHFSRTFRRHTGMTPAQYRSAFRQS